MSEKYLKIQFIFFAAANTIMGRPSAKRKIALSAPRRRQRAFTITKQTEK